MGRSSGPFRAVVVDGRALERSLVRFLLEENGVAVAAEAGTPFDAVRAVERSGPDVVVLNANTGWDAGRPLIPAIRTAAPDIVVVLIAPTAGAIDVELLRHADAVLEEGVGLKDLVPAITRLVSPRPAGKEPAPPAAGAAPVAVEDEGDRIGGERWSRWMERLRGASIAAVLLLGVMFVRSSLPPTSVSLALERADAKIDELIDALEDGDAARAERAAFELLILWHDAEEAGADPEDLAVVAAELSDPEYVEYLLGRVPATSEVVAAVLETIVDDTVEAPSPSPTPPATPTSDDGQGAQAGQGPNDEDHGQGGPPNEPPGTTPPAASPAGEASPSPVEPSSSSSEPSPSETSPSPSETSPTPSETSPPPSPSETSPPPSPSETSPPPTPTWEPPSPSHPGPPTSPGTSTGPPPGTPPTGPTGDGRDVTPAFALLVPGVLLWLRVRARRRER